jgi:hypothetical protein
MATITILSRNVVVNINSSWIFHISAVDAAVIIADHYSLTLELLSGAIVHPSLSSAPWSELYSGTTLDPYGSLWNVTDNGSGDWSINFLALGPNFTDIADWSNFEVNGVAPPAPPAPGTSLPILLQWSNAFDAEYNIVGYELSYKTTGSWQDLPFINSSQTSGSYSFTPQQLVTHQFRIRIRDAGGEVSPTYKYFNYVITSNYQISSEYSFQGGEANSCPITTSNTNNFNTAIFLSSEPPALGVIVYTNSIQTNTFNGMILLANQYWIIKSPSGLFYSCKINSVGVIVETPYLCGVGKTARISAGKVGTTAAGFCELPLTNNVYWNTANFAVGTNLFSDSDCTTPFIGAKLFYIVEYIDVSTSVTLTKVVQIGTNANTSVIVSIVNKVTVCSLIRPGFRSDPNANCLSTSTISCHIRSANPIGVGSGDQVCINSSGTPFPGGDLTYRVFITTLLQTDQIYALCKINNDGIITITPTYCSNFDLGGGNYGGIGYSGGSGPKIICNLLYSQGFLSKEIWEADEKFGRLMLRKNKEVSFGYLTWAKPVVSFLTKNPQYSKYLYLIVKPWSEHMAYTMRVLQKDNKIGKIINYIGSKFSILIYKLITTKRKKRRK